jgi:type II secretory pathway pseudopilin PulG
MNRHNSIASAARLRRRSQRAFTMIEIALAIGVIGFALVAIIGLLPAGLNVQKDNREDTIVSQDAPYFLNAIRDGEMRTNHNILANYVESITISNVTDGTLAMYDNQSLLPAAADNTLSNDLSIIGLLSTPEYDPRQVNGAVMFTNQVTAIVRAMTGAATEQGGSNAVMAFKYLMTVEVVPSTYYYDTNPPTSTDPVQYAYQSNLWWRSQYELQYLTNSLHEVRLHFSWPLIESGTNIIVGPNHQTYRTLVAGHLMVTNPAPPYYWFFQPNYFTNGL